MIGPTTQKPNKDIANGYLNSAQTRDGYNFTVDNLAA